MKSGAKVWLLQNSIERSIREKEEISRTEVNYGTWKGQIQYQFSPQTIE